MREDPVFQIAAAAVNGVQQHLAVQPQLQCPADLRIVQRPDRFVQGNIRDADLLHRSQLILIDIAVDIILGSVADVVQIQDIQLAAVILHALFHKVGDEAKLNPVIFRRSGPAVGVGLQDNALVRNPAVKDEGPGADRVIRRFAETDTGFRRALFIQNGCPRHGKAGQESGKRLFQSDGEIPIVQNMEALQHIGLTLFQPVSPQDIPGDVTVAGIRVRQQPEKGIVHIVRGQECAVVEPDPVAQMEGVAQAVIGHHPGFGQGGNDRHLAIRADHGLDQTVKNVLGDGIINRRALEIHRIRLFIHNGQEALVLLCLLRRRVGGAAGRPACARGKTACRQQHRQHQTDHSVRLRKSLHTSRPSQNDSLVICAELR